MTPIALLAGLLVAVQADGAGPDIACVTAQITPPGAQALVAEIAGDGARPIRDSFRTAAAACARDRDWTADYSGSIEQLAAGEVLLPILRARLVATGTRVEIVDAWLASTPYRPGGDRAATRAALGELERRLTAAGLTRDQVYANFELVGFYIGGQMAVREIRQRLSRPRGDRADD